MKRAAVTRVGGWCRWGLLSGVLGLVLMLAGPVRGSAAGADSGGFPLGREYDFDHSGAVHRVVQSATGAVLQRRDPGSGGWVQADLQLPEGLRLTDESGGDAGLRFVDLNGDGFLDVVFADSRRYAVYLWNKNVRPDLGWARGWSQEVSIGNRSGGPQEPPSMVGAGVRVESGWLLVTRSGGGLEERVRVKTLLDIPMPPPKSPEEALGTMRVRSGFKVELVAAEPVVLDPIAFDWGADGRMWVVEMRDYPLGMDGKGAPGGVIKVLEDPDAQGRFRRAVNFMEGIPFPTSVMPWGKGALIAAAPDLIYAEDTDGDGKADVQRVMFTGFHPGNQQHRFNGFEWGLDGWVYGANGDSGGTVKSMQTGRSLSMSGRDLRFRPDTGAFETVSAQTQFGRHRDDWGNWFGNNNPTWLWHVTLPEHYLRRNPSLAVKSVLKVLANYENSTRVYPVSPAMVRANQPWALNHVTSGSTPSPYRDDLFGPEFAGTVFIGEPVHNAVHREVLEAEGSGFRSHRAEGELQSEFLASTDNWFRPVTVKTGPDGALYVADMYRFVLEHPEWIPPEMQARLELRAGEDRGRIYRVVPVDAPRRSIPNLARLDPPGWVAAMDSPNGWQRDMAQRLLVERGDAAVAGSLRALLGVRHRPQVRVQALATLGLLKCLTPELLVAAMLDPHPGVRVEALRQSESLEHADDALFRAVAGAAGDPDAAVRCQAAFTLGEWPGGLAEPVLRELAARPDTDERIRVAIQSSLRPDSRLFATMKALQPVVKVEGPAVTLRPSSADRARVIGDYAGVGQLKGDGAKGRLHFQALCAPCHRMRGEGREVGPDLGMVASKPVEWLLVAILDPSQAVDVRYRGWTVSVVGGEPVSGLISAETANNVVLRVAGGGEQAILRRDIQALEPMKESLMPTGFESALKPQDLADLLQWIRAGDGRQP